MPFFQPTHTERHTCSAFTVALAGAKRPAATFPPPAGAPEAASRRKPRQRQKKGWRIIQSSIIIHPWSGFHVWFLVGCSRMCGCRIPTSHRGNSNRSCWQDKMLSWWNSIILYIIILILLSSSITNAIAFIQNDLHLEVHSTQLKWEYQSLCLMRKGWTDYPLKRLESSPTDFMNLNSAKPFGCRINVSTSSIPLAYPSTVFHSQSLPQAVVE